MPGAVHQPYNRASRRVNSCVELCLTVATPVDSSAAISHLFKEFDRLKKARSLADQKKCQDEISYNFSEKIGVKKVHELVKNQKLIFVP